MLTAYSKQPPTLDAANSLYASRRFAEAAEAYRSFLAASPRLPKEVEARFNLGEALRAMSQFTNAVVEFELVVKRIDTAGRDGTASFKEVALAASAQWKIVTSYMAAGEYQRALAALSETKRRSVPLICGNAMAEESNRLLTHEGACYDGMGETKKALERYFRAAKGSALLLDKDPAVHLRIVTIYEEAGELAKLVSLLDDFDETEFERLRKGHKMYGGATLSRERFLELRETRIMRRVIELRMFAAQGQRSKLIDLLRTASWWWVGDKRQGWEALESLACCHSGAMRSRNNCSSRSGS